MKKRAILVLVAILMVSVLAFSLCACDDKDKNGNNNVNGNNENGIDFTGMTKEEIINLADTVTSFSYTCGDSHFSYLYEFVDKGYRIFVYNNDVIFQEDYFFNEDGYQYSIYCYYGPEEGPRVLYDTPYVYYYKDNTTLNLTREEFKTLLGSDFNIDGNKLIIDDAQYPEFINKVNATKWTLPEKFSNYKELAVEG